MFSSVLYIFCGMERKGDVGSYLKEIQQKIDIPLVLVERDLVREGQEHDMLDVEVQEHFKEPMKKAVFS